MGKPKTRKEIESFLSNHSRYNDRGSFFSRNIKLHMVSFPDAETRDRAWEMLDVDEAYEDFNDVLQDFAATNEYFYQIRRCGRSGGYLVLLDGGRKETGHKSFCPACGQRNFQVAKEGDLCGVCHKPRRNYDRPPKTTYTTGKTIGEPDGDYSDWCLSSLKNLMNVVWSFDKACQQAVDAFISFAAENEAVEETFLVPQQVKVCRPVE